MEPGDLTLHEYTLLRDIASRGDWHISHLQDIPHFSDKAYLALVRKKLLLRSKVNKAFVHPSPEVSTLLATARHILGIDRI